MKGVQDNILESPNEEKSGGLAGPGARAVRT